VHEFIDDTTVENEDGDTITIQRCECGASQEVEVF